MPFQKGHPGGPGRPRKRDANAGAITRAEKQIRDRLPEVVDKMLELAMGVLVEEQTLEGRFIYQKPPDYKAAAYLIDRIMGKPTERREVKNQEGPPIPWDRVPDEIQAEFLAGRIGLEDVVAYIQPRD